MNKPNTIEGVYDGLLESVRRVDNFPKPEAPEQIVYKLKHTPTGLFFSTPDYLLGNVSRLGTVFTTTPPRKGKITIPKGIAEGLGYDCINSTVTKKCKLSDWEVVEYKLVKLNKGE